MRICLDVRYKTESGSSAYIRNLVPELMAQGKGNEFVLVKYPRQEFDFEAGVSEVWRCPGESDALSMAWTVGALPRALKGGRIGLYHTLKMPGPFWNPVPNVSTMHSVMKDFSKSYPGSMRSKLFDYLYARRMVDRPHRIVAVSEFVKDYLAERHGVPAEKIDLIYHGVDPSFRPLSVEDTARARSKGIGGVPLPARYALCVGNVFPVKNHITAVRAFAAAVCASRGAGLSDGIADLHLVIAGGTEDPYCRLVEQEVRRFGLEKRVRLAGFVPGRELIGLMNAAEVLLFPSLTEGCPVTLLEAFAAGLPVVASKRGGLWDVGKGAALFVDDPLDHAGFARRLTEVLGAARLRDDLRRRGLRHAESFSWQAAAAAHLETYRRCAAEAGLS